MEGTSRVNVKIFGQTYTIAGDASKNYILKIAEFVNDKMVKVANGVGRGMTSTVAVLTAVNITEDYFRAVEEREAALQEAKKTNADIANYQKLWEDSKTGFLQHSKELQNAIDQLDETKQMLDEQISAFEALEVEKQKLNAEKEDLEKKYIALQAKMDDFMRMKQDAANQMQELSEKEKEFENSFFDIQMENVRLKNELDKFRKDRSER